MYDSELRYLTVSLSLYIVLLIAVMLCYNDVISKIHSYRNIRVIQSFAHVYPVAT